LRIEFLARDEGIEEAADEKEATEKDLTHLEVLIEIIIRNEIDANITKKHEREREFNETNYLLIEMVTVKFVLAIDVGNVGFLNPVMKKHPYTGQDCDKGDVKGEKEVYEKDRNDLCVLLFDVVRRFIANFIGFILRHATY
jgi:hypothetical protein